MEQTREHLEQQPKPSSRIAGDMQRLKTDASSTAGEVREFMATLKGRSPQEVLGAISQSSLVQSTIQATFVCALLLVALTVLPWAMASEEPATAAAPAEEATGNTEATTETASTESEATSNAASAEPGSSADSPTGSDAARAAAAMKIDETVVADPNKNPLDGNLDKLLDGVD